jgi:hypothetical protein
MKGGTMAGQNKITIDHDEIRKWADERGGKPSSVKSTKGKVDVGILRINFPGRGAEASLSEISWDAFFKKFEEKKLAFLYQEKTSDGKPSRFFKFVSRSGRAAKSLREREAVGV